MRQHDPFRIAGRSRREDDRRHLVKLVAANARQEGTQQRRRNRLGHDSREHLVRRRDPLRQVLQVDQLPLGRQLELVDHTPRRQNMRNFTLVDRGVDDLLAGRVIQVDRDEAAERQGRHSPRPSARSAGSSGRRASRSRPRVAGAVPAPRRGAGGRRRRASSRCCRSSRSISHARGPSARRPTRSSARPPARAARRGRARKGRTRKAG